jgi:DNA-binding CsgD family transcriptional regulator
VAVTGEAGIGKTALLAQVLDEADGFRVLRGRGFESETEIPYAGLLALVRPLLDLAGRLPEQQAAALRSALALGPPTPQDRFAVPVSLLALLGAAADEQPLLVAVDDAHWLDPATREALFFAARRLEAEGVGVLLSVRETDGEPSIDLAGLERLELGGLDASGARSLLAGDVAPSVADALARATGGNPLALLELTPVLSEPERRGLRPIRTPLPTGERVEEIFSRQVAELPPSTRRALGVAAALDGAGLDELFAALGRMGLSEDDLGPAEGAGVITVRGTRVTFRHPLVRSAAYQAQPIADRRAAHAALAEVSADSRQRAWHRAQAATGRDETVAAELAAAAEDALQRGGPAEAALTWARAAELSPDATAAAVRRLSAASASHQAGGLDQTLRLLDLAEPDLPPEALTGARRLRALLTLRIGDIQRAVDMFEAEAARLAETDPAAAAETLIGATPAYMYTGRNDDMLAFGERARALVGDHDSQIAELAEVVVAMARSARGLMTPEEEAIFSSPVIDPTSTQPAEIMLGCTHGLMFRERYAVCRGRIDAHVDEARRAGAAMRLIYPLALRAEYNHRTGHWPAAMADITESVRLADETGTEMIAAGHPISISGLVHLDVGDLELARERMELAGRLAERTGADTVMLWVRWARGRLALLEGDPRRAVEPLLSVVSERDRMGWGETHIVLTDGDLADALLLAGERDEAARQSERMHRVGEAMGRRYLLATAERIDAMLAGDDAFEAHFERALAHFDAIEVGLPFERARAELWLGRRRRLAGRNQDAREPLERTLAEFERLGARPWTAMVREELRLVGARSAEEVVADPAEALSAQEWRVAQLVAGGMTNREVAGALFLSPKTIEHHLSGIYRKLGVRSRTQLARLFAADGERSAA